MRTLAKVNTAFETQPGDLARRITHRRQELGLTDEDLARQAGLDAGFLEYFELNSDVQLSRQGRSTRSLAFFRRLRQAFSVGTGIGRRGNGGALPGAVLEPLTPAQCRAHLTRVV